MLHGAINHGMKRMSPPSLDDLVTERAHSVVLSHTFEGNEEDEASFCASRPLDFGPKLFDHTFFPISRSRASALLQSRMCSTPLGFSSLMSEISSAIEKPLLPDVDTNDSKGSGICRNWIKRSSIHSACINSSRATRDWSSARRASDGSEPDLWTPADNVSSSSRRFSVLI